MRDYGKVKTTFWTDERTRGLSDRGKLLALYLLSGPHANAIGCFRLPSGYISEDLKWPSETVSQTLSELSQKGFAYRCERTEWVFVCHFLRHNEPENPNVAKAMAKLIDDIPKKAKFYRDFVAALEPYGKRFREGYVEGLLNGISNPEPEPEPEPEQEPEPPSGSRGAGAPPAAPQLALQADDDLTDLPAHLVRGELGQAIALWNAMAEGAGLPRVDKLTSKRRRALTKRLRDCGGIDGWRMAMDRVGASPFLRGERPGKGHENWKCGFDFILDEEHFTKLMEGSYDDRQAAAASGTRREILEAVGLAPGLAGN